MSEKDVCNTCGCKFDGEQVRHQSSKNRNFLATVDKNGEVIRECCEACAQECVSMVEGK